MTTPTRWLRLAFFLLPFFAQAQSPCRQIIGYYPNWQWYDRSHLVNPTTIAYEKYTILNYAFFKPEANGAISSTDAWADENLLLGQINWSTNPPSYFPNTSIPDLCHDAGKKLLPSIGGWTLSNNFPGIAADPVKRATFAHHCILLCQQYDFDGVDIDWEYPGYAEHNGSPADKANFTLLLQQIRDSLTAYGNATGDTMLLTACFGASPGHMSNIEFDDVVPLLDYLNLMSYDFFGTWDFVANHNSPLFAPAQGSPVFNVSSAVEALINDHDVPPGKINAGVAFYGRSQKTVGAPALFAATNGQADNATFWQDEGTPLYYNVQEQLGLFTQHWDAQAQVPYLTGNGSLQTFVSFDDPQSVALKAQFVNDNDLAGLIIWEITGDYVAAPGGGIAGTPLVDTINAVFCSAGGGGGNDPPTVGISAPADGAYFYAPATVVISASADVSPSGGGGGSISKVRFFLGNTLLGQDKTPPFEWTLNNLPAGFHQISAKAWDDSSAVATSNVVTIRVLNPGENIPPTVSLTAPAAGAQFSEGTNLTISASAADQNGTVASVKFYDGSTLLHVDFAAPFSFVWQNVPAGTKNLRAKVTDNEGATTLSPIVTVTVASGGAPVCSAPATFYFDPATYQNLGEIKLGQGQLYPIWGVSTDVYVPTNRLRWAIGMVHGAHLFRNVTGTADIPANFYFATAAKESYCGCDPGISAAPPGSQFPFTYQPASVGDGCYQIEGNSAYNELVQQYPQRFPTGEHGNLIAGHHFETASLCKAYYDIFAVKYWEVHKGWNPIGFFNQAADPNAARRLMAVAYNRGLWYSQLGVVLDSDRPAALVAENLAPYFVNNNYGYDYQNALTNYCLVLENQAVQLDSALLATNPATGQPYNFFDNYYDPPVTWADLNAYLDSIAILYPEVNFPDLKDLVQATFDSIAGGNPISFRYELGTVLDTLILNLPADDPTTNIATIYGCASGSGGGNGGGGSPCNAPSGLSVTNLNDDSATLNWSAASGATSYSLRYKPTSSGTWTTATTTDISLQINDLDSCTNYEWQVQTVCGSGSSSFCPVQIFSTPGCSTPPPAPSNYCSSFSLNSTAEWVQTFAMAGYVKNSGNNNGFGNYANEGPTLTGGDTVSMTLTPGFPSGSQTEFWRVWVDWNRDGDFADPGEMIADVSSAAAVTLSVPVPENLSFGYARLRVSMKRTAPASDCDVFVNGEVEDYQALLELPSPFGEPGGQILAGKMTGGDLGVIAILSPVDDCNLGAAEPVKVVVKNFGASAESNFDVAYRLGNLPPVVQSVGSLSVGAGDTVHFTFATPADFSAFGSHDLEAYTSVSGDPAAANDTLGVAVVNFQTPVPAIVASANPVCEGDLVSLSVGFIPGASYAWSTGGGWREIAVNPTSSTTYSVSVTVGENGCSASDSLILTPLPGIEAVVTPFCPPAVCYGEPVSFTALAMPAASSFSWNTGASGATISATEPGVYSVMATAANGCTGEAGEILETILPVNLTLDDVPLPSGTYHSSGILTVLNASVATGSAVILKGETGVLLGENFEVELGGELDAVIEACPVNFGEAPGGALRE